MFKKSCPTKRYHAYLALITATAIWGGAGPVIKLTLDFLPATSFLFFRFLLVCLVLLPIIIIELKKRPIDNRDIPTLIVLGLLSQTSIIIAFWGYKFTTALDASLIHVTYPIMAVAAGHIFYKEKVSKLEEVGIAIATLGTLLIIFEPLFTGKTFSKQSEVKIFGNILILLYQLTWITYIIWSRRIMGHKAYTTKKFIKWLKIKPLKRKYPPVILTMITFYMGLATLIPLVALEMFGVFGGQAFSVSNLTATPILGVLYMALLSSIAAYMLFQWGLDNAEVADTALFAYLGPIFTFPAAYLLLKEVPSPMLVIGAGIITLGVVIAEKYKS